MHFRYHFFDLEAFGEPLCLFNLVDFSHIHHSESVRDIGFQIEDLRLKIEDLFFADSHIDIDEGEFVFRHLR